MTSLSYVEPKGMYMRHAVDINNRCSGFAHAVHGAAQKKQGQPAKARNALANQLINQPATPVKQSERLCSVSCCPSFCANLDLSVDLSFGAIAP
ncbi:unnamed protein product [Clonostachys solani]|uniref:Uncharacterized protein n=1 Tax=Clonostachys solani TaxID=160281 RepID=A0A9N9YYZ3_9HYPO|nr:unnamed protein product [Clonostachys solani]